MWLIFGVTGQKNSPVTFEFIVVHVFWRKIRLLKLIFTHDEGEAQLSPSNLMLDCGNLPTPALSDSCCSSAAAYTDTNPTRNIKTLVQSENNLLRMEARNQDPEGKLPETPVVAALVRSITTF